MISRFPTKELAWLVPFLCLAAIAAVVAHPEPHAPEPQDGRVVVDVRGKHVNIPLPFRGSVLTHGTHVPQYLEATLAPSTLLGVTAYHMGDRVRGHIIGRIFPQVVANPRIWATKGISDVNGPKAGIERLLLFNPSVYMGWYTLAGPIERVGLPFVGFDTADKTQADLDYPTRAYAGVVGKPARGEALIAQTKALFHALDEELRPAHISHPRSYLYLLSHREGGKTIVLGAANVYTRFLLPHTGVVNACACPASVNFVDVEHIIADDPDIIVLDPHSVLERPSEFATDPRWRGLKAVRNHRVYRAPPGIDQYIAGPFWARWLAELAHPDRLQPKSRELYRAYIEQLLGYRLTGKDLDEAFAVEDNRGMAHAERFEAQNDEP